MSDRRSRAGGNQRALLHELAAAKRSDVLWRQGEPLTGLPTIFESPMPIGLDARGIVGLDRVNDDSPLGKLDCEFSLSSPYRIRTTDLEMFPRLQQVDAT